METIQLQGYFLGSCWDVFALHPSYIPIVMSLNMLQVTFPVDDRRLSTRSLERVNVHSSPQGD